MPYLMQRLVLLAGESAVVREVILVCVSDHEIISLAHETIKCSHSELVWKSFFGINSQPEIQTGESKKAHHYLLPFL